MGDVDPVEVIVYISEVPLWRWLCAGLTVIGFVIIAYIAGRIIKFIYAHVFKLQYYTAPSDVVARLGFINEYIKRNGTTLESIQPQDIAVNISQPISSNKKMEAIWNRAYEEAKRLLDKHHSLRSIMRSNVAAIVHSVIQFTIFMIGIWLACKIMQISVLWALAGVGAFGILIVVAAQEPIKNVASGFVTNIQNGKRINIAGASGTVIELGWTHFILWDIILTPDGNLSRVLLWSVPNILYSNCPMCDDLTRNLAVLDERASDHQYWQEKRTT